MLDWKESTKAPSQICSCVVDQWLYNQKCTTVCWISAMPSDTHRCVLGRLKYRRKCATVLDQQQQSRKRCTTVCLLNQQHIPPHHHHHHHPSRNHPTTHLPPPPLRNKKTKTSAAVFNPETTTHPPPPIHPTPQSNPPTRSGWSRIDFFLLVLLLVCLDRGVTASNQSPTMNLGENVQVFDTHLLCAAPLQVLRREERWTNRTCAAIC